ncbi:MAG: hypothetical protein EFT35_07195 [Methanophagales archaeon ANME-1-THS]|nr:MAG: hypothetical protein EFT35_07195 [Methanophagales archaeon ANME-1-THS]
MSGNYNAYYERPGYAKKEEWRRCKLHEILSDPAFMGKTIKLGGMVFEVKGVSKTLVWAGQNAPEGGFIPHEPNDMHEKHRRRVQKEANARGVSYPKGTRY